MITINGEKIDFGWIPNMYKGGFAGVGIQVDEDVDSESARKMCVKIAEAVEEFINGN
jgi:hypothetical protein